MDAIGAKDTELRHYLTKFVSLCRNKIAEQFGCTVWIFHQIKASMVTASSTKLFHHGDAAEAGAFAAELAVCGCMGVPDKETGCRRINFSKVRYKPGEEIPPLTVKLHRQFSMLEDVGNQYGIDDAGHKFALLSDLARTSTAGAHHHPGGLPSGPPGLHRPTDPSDDLPILN
jgi:hypothetical protein